MSPGNQLAGDSKQAAPADLPEGTPSDWWSTVQKNIQDSEYHVTWQEKTVLADVDAAWQPPNRTNSLCTYFTEDGVRVISRTSQAPEWTWGLSLDGYGVVGDVQPVEPATLVPPQIAWNTKGVRP